MSGRRQTTKGIWLALGQKVQEPRTLLLDLEGSDGRERGEDDNSFERQSSLFALAVAGGGLVLAPPSKAWLPQLKSAVACLTEHHMHGTFEFDLVAVCRCVAGEYVGKGCG